jgi:hypothetical protein
MGYKGDPTNHLGSSMIKRKKAKCPHCQALHAYEELSFNAINDKGYWEVSCQQCEKVFGLRVINPSESSMRPNFLVTGRYEDVEPPSNLRLASDIIEYNLDLNRISHSFDYGGAPIYLCSKSLTNLEIPAYQELKSSLPDIKLHIPVIANSDSEGSRTAARAMANRCPGDGEESERSDAVFKNISNNFH